MDAGPASIALGSSDRVQRFSARTALENASSEAFQTLLLDPASNPWQVIGGAIGLARTGTAAQMLEILKSLDNLDWAALDTRQRINWLRAGGLVFARHGMPGDATRQQVIAKIDASFPSADAMLHRELCRMLSYLQAPGVVARTLTLMDNAGPAQAPDWLALAERNGRYGESVKKMIANLPPAQVIHYVYCLRVVKGPWHEDERKRFFAWLSKLSGNAGGASYDGFINDLRRETIASSTPGEREWLEKLDTRPPANPFADLPPATASEMKEAPPGRT
jgi:hypothetical protein